MGRTRCAGGRLIVRIEIHRDADVYEYRVIADGDVLFDDAGFSSVVHCLAGAVEGLPPEVRAVEVACGGVVSGTYPLTVLAANSIKAVSVSGKYLIFIALSFYQRMHCEW